MDVTRNGEETDRIMIIGWSQGLCANHCADPDHHPPNQNYVISPSRQVFGQDTAVHRLS
jgi:hypothetical protein